MRDKQRNFFNRNFFKRNFFIGWLIFLAGVLAVNAVPAKAEDMDFQVMPVFPENQQVQNVNYFDLLLQQDAVQTIRIRVKNLSKETKKIHVEVNQAATNYNGVVEYLDQSVHEDKAPFPIKDAVAFQETWTLKKGETIEIPFKLTMPDIAYEGVVAGGICISDMTSADAADDSSVVVRNKYRYVLALLLQTDTQTVAPKLDLGKVSPQTINHSDVIGVDLENLANTYVQDVRVEAAVSKEDEGLNFVSEKSNMKIAPSSTFTYPVPVAEDLPAGDYRVVLTAYAQQEDKGEHKAKDGKRYRYKWHFDKQFTLQETVIKGSSKPSTFVPKKNYGLYLILFLLLTGCFAGIGRFYQRRKKPKTFVEK